MTDTTTYPWNRRRWAVGLLALAVVEVVGTVGASRHENGARALDVWTFVLVFAGLLALLWLPRRPGHAVVMVVAATLAYLAAGYAYGPMILSAVVALFAAVVLGHRLLAWVGFACLYVGHAAASYVIGDEQVTWGELLGVAAWGMVILVSAEVVRVRRERMAAASRARQEVARRQANDERLRIARELHDVVAHHMSLINVQASVALHLVDRRPDQVQTALTVIKDASKEALVELRSLVGVLRDEADAAPRAPTATLDSLDDLVERGALAGLTIRKNVVGEGAPLSAAVDLAAFRIIQEAVTNVVRHASASRVEITLDFRNVDELCVQVDDDGAGGAVAERGLESAWTQGDGNGLRGMQERATALGGRLGLGRAAIGGVSIRATLPLGGPA